MLLFMSYTVAFSEIFKYDITQFVTLKLDRVMSGANITQSPFSFMRHLFLVSFLNSAFGDVLQLKLPKSR